MEDKKLKAETVTAIYNEILQALKDLVGEPYIKSNKMPIYDFYNHPAFLVIPCPTSSPADDNKVDKVEEPPEKTHGYS